MVCHISREERNQEGNGSTSKMCPSASLSGYDAVVAMHLHIERVHGVVDRRGRLKGCRCHSPACVTLSTCSVRTREMHRRRIGEK